MMIEAVAGDSGRAAGPPPDNSGRAAGPPPGDSVGVLLPVGLETRFLAPGEDAEHPGSIDPAAPAEWRIRLRVTPDEIWLDRHDPYVTEAEKLALEAMWSSLETNPDPADPAGSIGRAQSEIGWPDAFGRLAGQVGAPRATWLARTVPVVRPDGGPAAASPTAADSAREGAALLRGLPAMLQVWVRWRGDADDAAPEVIGELHPQLDASGTALSPERAARLARWEGAKEAGLADEFGLGTRHPREILVLGVSGLGSADGTTPQNLWQAHAEAGRLTVLEPGLPTSSVRGQATVGPGTDVSDWRHITLDQDPTGTMEALAGPGAGVRPVLASPWVAESRRVSHLLANATFPALWGYGFAGPLNILRHEELGPLWTWAAEWLRPEGNFASLRVGGGVYGVVPIADPGLVTSSELHAVAPLLPFLARLGPKLAAAAGADPGLAVGHDADGNETGGGVDDAVRTLRRGPVPGGVGWVRSLPVELHAALTAPALGVPVERAIADWDAANAATLDILGDRPRRRYASRVSQTSLLSIPLIGPGLDDPAGPPSDPGTWLNEVHDIFESLAGVVVNDIGEDRRLLLSQDYQSRVESLLVRLYARSLAIAAATIDVRWLEATGTFDPYLPASLLELILVGAAPILTRRHIDALGSRGNIDHSAGDDLVRQLMWLADNAGPEISHLLQRAGEEPQYRRLLTRGLRALVEASSNRWDVWYSAVGSAHLQVAYARGATPILGAYGWVDAPYRGKPGPGSGGLLMAPSLSHAATAATLRDGAIRDPDPALWSMTLDSGTVGPAQRLLADLAAGWHPAEVLGRMIERRFGDGLADDATSRIAGLKWLRKEYPLRQGAGAIAEPFGCCHGLDVINADPGAFLQVDPWPSLPEEAGDAIREAIATVAAVVDAAADLELAEGVHGFLAGNPARAAVATKSLGGALPPGMLDVLDPARPVGAVHTLVLAALPARDPVLEPGGAWGAIASPGFDAVLASRFGPEEWNLTLSDGAGDFASLPLSALGLGPADAAALGDESLIAMARLAARLGGEVRTATTVTVPEAIGKARNMARLLRGRTADVDDLRPPNAAASGEPAAVAARAEVQSVLLGRVALLTDRATSLVERLESALVAASRHDELVALAMLDDLEEPEPSGPSNSDLASLMLGAAAWGASAPDGAEKLAGPESPGPDIRANVLAALRQIHSQLKARLAASAEALAGGTLATGQVEPAGSSSATAATSAISRLIGDKSLPIGVPLASSFLGGDLADAASTETKTGWLPAIKLVRPRLNELAKAAGELAWFGISPGDPWRIGALAASRTDPSLIMPSPRFEAVVTVAETIAPAATAEWIVLDAFSESVPLPDAVLGTAFDAATPGAAPPQAVLLVPPQGHEPSLAAGDLPAAVLYARSLARIRMVDPAAMARTGLGALAAYAALPQERSSGCPLVPSAEIPDEVTFDDVGILQPRITHADTDDVIAAVTADPLWMLGVQWRLGEHAGEDAATPAAMVAVVSDTSLDAPLPITPVEQVVETSEHWDSADLAYGTDLIADEVSLAVTAHPGGPFDWWAVTANGTPAGVDREVAVVPGRMTWPGAPRRRYWQIEDVRHDPAGAGPDAAHPATLHLLRLLSRHGDDWYLAPVPSRVGSIVRPRTVTLIDAAGGQWKLRTPNDWSLFAVAGLDPVAPIDPANDDPEGQWHRALPVFATAPSALAGPATEEIGLAIDEDDNLLWASVLREDEFAVPPEEGPAASLRDSAAEAGLLAVEWQLRTTPPSNRVPYLYGGTFDSPAYGAGTDLFVQARLLRPSDGTVQAPPVIDLLQAPIGQPAHVLRPLAVPSSGLRVEQRRMLARDVEGNPVAWVRRARRPLDVNTDVSLRWDLLVE